MKNKLPDPERKRRREATRLMKKCGCGNVARFGQDKCGRCIDTEAEFAAIRAESERDKEDGEFLRDLANRILSIAEHGVDQEDYDRLREIARRLDHDESEEI